MAPNRFVQASVFCLLVTLGVVGRWYQPDWCFTPLAAVSLFAGFYFTRRSLAYQAPLAILAISDLILPAYGGPGVMLTVYAVALVPVFLGRRLREKGLLPGLAWAGVAPAVLFWLASNLAVWMFQDMYSPTLVGLLTCYAAAIPFFKSMLAGDLMYTTLIFGCYALSTDFAWTGRAAVAKASRS